MVRTRLATPRVSLGMTSWLLLAALSCGTSDTPNGELPGAGNLGGSSGDSGGAEGGSGAEPATGMGVDGPNEGTPEDIPIVSNPGEVPQPPGEMPPPAAPGSGDGFNILENLDRGVVAVPRGDGMYVGWRMFGYEYDREAPARISYNLYHCSLVPSALPTAEPRTFQLWSQT